MEQTNLGQLPALRLKKTVFVLTVITLVLLLPMVFINLVFEYEAIEGGSNIYTMHKAVVAAPTAYQVFAAVIAWVPPVMLLLALVSRPGKTAVTVLVAAAFAGLAVQNAAAFVINLLQKAEIIGMIPVAFVEFAIPAVLYVLAALSALKGLSVKALFFAPALMVIFLQLITLLFSSVSLYPHDFKTGLELMATSSILNSLQMILINLALLLFCVPNRIRPILPVSTQKESAAILRLPPNLALQRLNEDLQLGYLKPEDYARLRAIVLERL